jgi:hypothetical protein
MSVRQGKLFVFKENVTSKLKQNEAEVDRRGDDKI